MPKFRFRQPNGSYIYADAELPVTITDDYGAQGSGIFARTYKDSTIVSATLPPVNLTAPSISGLGEPGETLSLTGDTWDGATTYEYEWTSSVLGLVGTSATYIIDQEDAGATITARKRAITNATESLWVSATNSILVTPFEWLIEGSTIVQSPPEPPAPLVSGSTIIG